MSLAYFFGRSGLFYNFRRAEFLVNPWIASRGVSFINSAICDKISFQTRKLFSHFLSLFPFQLSRAICWDEKRSLNTRNCGNVFRFLCSYLQWHHRRVERAKFIYELYGSDELQPSLHVEIWSKRKLIKIYEVNQFFRLGKFHKLRRGNS